MEIRLQQMELRNFKGIRNLQVNFDGVTNIEGDNATGKTSIFDGFTWVLWGKSSSDLKEFSIKTLDGNNQPIHRLDHEVVAIISVDGREMKLRRLFREKWVKKRGSETTEFTGHESEFYIDDVPLSQNEYKARVDLIINDDISKLITNPLYFNQMKWTDRRVVLEAMAGPVADGDILDKITTNANKDAIASIHNELSRGKKIADFKREINAKKKLIKESLESIPTRIDEAERSKPDPQNFDAIEKDVIGKQSEVKQLEKDMDDVIQSYNKKFELIQDDNRKLNDAKLKLSQLQMKGRNEKSNALMGLDQKINTLELRIKNDQRTIDSNLAEVKRNQDIIATLENENVVLRDKWNMENAKVITFTDDEFNCPSCKQPLPEDQRENKNETLTNNFNANKIKVLKALSESGQHNVTRIESLKQRIVEMEIQTQDLFNAVTQSGSDIVQFKEEKIRLSNLPEGETDEMAFLKKEIDGFVIATIPPVDNTMLKNKRDAINLEIHDLNKILNDKDQITRITTRITELEKEERKLSQELADLERTEFVIDAFSKAKIETIEERINGKFKMVRFKMFEQQINGGETESCECLVDGVPFSDINTASKINAGIDIINALTEHYKMHAPVWIDNRESTIRILPCKSQIINLMAVKDKPLTVSAA